MRSIQATIVTDLGFGDAGKGTMVDYLARQGRVAAVVRFNGGGQAAHNVVTPDGRHHTFHQFGSGTFVPGVRTHLSRFMIVDPLLLYEESGRLHQLGCRSALARLSIDEEALVATPFQRAANRLRETLRGTSLHGSCGMGIGEVMMDSLKLTDPLRVKHLRDPEDLTRRFLALQEERRVEFSRHFRELERHPGLSSEVHVLTSTDYARKLANDFAAFADSLSLVQGEHLEQLARQGSLLFEGAQGVLLDEWRGFHPYTTWSTTTFENAETLLSEIGYSERIERLGVLRAYFTRHGAGPFVTEDQSLTAAIPDLHNGTGAWQGVFRIGWFDMVAAHYALAATGPIDTLAITNLDQIEKVGDRRICSAYLLPDGSRLERLPLNSSKTDLVRQEELTRLLANALPEYREASRDSEAYLGQLEEGLQLPVTYVSRGPSATDKYRRARKT